MKEIRVIQPEDWLVQNWKNGQGISNQIAIEEDANGMLWRISIAEVSQSGHFSLYPGVDRVILLLDGNGFNLSFANQRVKFINAASQPFAFAGEESIYCELSNGPLRDFNLMTRRQGVRAIVRVLELDHQQKSLVFDCQWLVVFVCSGRGVLLEFGADRQLTLQQEQSLIICAAKGPFRLSSTAARIIICAISLAV